MKKVVIIISVLILVFIISIFMGNSLYENHEIIENKYEKLKNDNNTEIAEEKNHINQKDELATSVLYDYKNEDGTTADDLMFTDMKWNNDSELYHKIITNEEDYNKYNSRFLLPEVNFDESFIVIVANESFRSQDENDLTIYEVIADETTTHIIMKQKENPQNYSDNNVFYAVVDKSELRENADVIIK